jgi:hypothetical protein
MLTSKRNAEEQEEVLTSRKDCYRAGGGLTSRRKL